MISYQALGKVTNSALLLLAVTMTFAAIDHFYFQEEYRNVIRIAGLIPLTVFILGISAGLIKGILDKI